MITIITKGGVKEGFGHIMRMIWLLKELKVDGEFVLVEGDRRAKDFIEDNGFNIKNNLNGEIVFFDMFDVPRNLIKRGWRKVVLFDSTTFNDLVDVSVNALVGCQGHGRCYGGLKYLILRKEFHEFWKKNRKIKDELRRILVIFGGSDPSNYTARTVRILQDFDVTAVLGPGFVHDVDLDCRIVFKSNRVAELMFEHDLVITSLGLTMFEALCVGTPAIAICQNDTQRWLLKHMPFLKLVFERFNEDDLRRVIENLRCAKLRHDLSVWGKSLCDGLGLYRVINIIKREIL